MISRWYYSKFNNIFSIKFSKFLHGIYIKTMCIIKHFQTSTIEDKIIILFNTI